MTMHPLFAQILSVMDPVKPQPAPVAAPQRKPYSCNACRDTGDTESGGACGWCGPQTTGSDDLIGDVEEY
jgi:hypothetical protein